MSLDISVVYRPARFSVNALRSVVEFMFRRPIAFSLLLGECLCLAVTCPRLAIVLFANLHTVCFFARQVVSVQATMVYGYFLNLPGLVGMGVSILTGVPFLVAGHARDVFADGGAAGVLTRRARHVVVCHRAAAEALESRLPESQRGKVQVVHHGVNTSEEVMVRNSQGHMPTVIGIGRFVPKKGFDYLIRAVAQLRSRGLAVKLVLTGDGPEMSRLHDLARELDMSDQVLWPGWVEQDCLCSMLREASIVVVPSIVDHEGDRDGIPNVVLEAWGAGVPVIASDLPSLREVISDTVHGVLFQSGNERELADAIEKVLNSSRLQESLIQHGRQRLREDFDTKTNGERLLRLLNGSFDL